MRRGQAVREARRKGAEERQAERDRRTDQQQIKKLTDAGHGACREVGRLVKRINKAKKENTNGPTE